MQPIEIKPGIFYVGVNDEKTELFDGLWPIKNEGVSYNSYLIKDKKTAVIELSKDVTTADYFTKLKSVVDPATIDYVVINHMEPDHTGAMEEMRRLNPRVTLVGTEKTKAMLASFYGITENIQVVNEGDTINLGNHTLQFFSTPNVHWPETMMTYETSQKVLFSCDGFGGFGKLGDGIFEDTCQNLDWYEQEAIRYFCNIVVSFSKPVLMAIAKLANLTIDMVAPSHGLIWRKDPQRIIQLYEKWSKYRESADPGITLLVGSVYHFTEKMAKAVEEGMKKTGIKVNKFNVSTTNISYILPSLISMQGVAIGAPTYEGRLYPAMTQVLDMAAFKHLSEKKAIYFGSFGWGGGALRQITEKLETMKWELTDSLEFIGRPTTETLKKGQEVGEKLAKYLLTK
jgi:anaerobic nitric oxide reductase flavorubredoxin